MLRRSLFPLSFMLVPLMPLSAQARRLAPSDLDSVRGFVRRIIDIRATPGVGLAIVQGDRTVLAEGFGYRNVVRRLPVTESTRFYLASHNKAFTAMAASRMAARGALDLDTPIGRLLPDARFPGAAGDSITLRALLTHTAGLSNDPMVIRTAFMGDFTHRSLVAMLPASELRSREFVYDNFHYVVAMMALERSSGTEWQELLEREIFRPLGMRNTSQYRSKLANDDVALPHAVSPDGFRLLPEAKNDRNVNAAGGGWATPGDLGRWLAANMSEGRVDGKQALPAAAVAEVHRSQAKLDRNYGEIHRYAYGLGWYHADWHGDSVVHNFGSFPGSKTHVSFVPKLGVGVVVVTNALNGPAGATTEAIARYVYDLAGARSGLARRADSMVAVLGAAGERSRSRVVNHTLAAPDHGAVGRYANVGGEVHIATTGDTTWLRMGGLRGALLGPANDSTTALRVELVPGDLENVELFRGSSGRVDSVGVFDVIWRRIPDGAFGRRQTPDTIVNLAFELTSGRIYIPVYVNNRGPYRFMLDTGASGVGRADARLAESLGLAIVDSTDNSDGVNVRRVAVVAVDSLRLGSYSRVGVTVLSRDYNTRASPGTPITFGILGRDFFEGFLLTLDYPARRVIVTREDLSAEQANVVAYQRPFVVPVEIGDVRVEGFLDTGSVLTIHFPMHYRDSLGVTDLKAAGTARRANTTFQLFTGTLPEPVVIAGQAMDGVNAIFSPEAPDVGVGGMLLQPFAISFDQRNRLIRIVRKT